MRILTSLSCLILILALTPALRAQLPGEQLCPNCHSTGRIEVKFKPDELEKEEGAKYCSVFMQDHAESLGLDWMPCDNCLTPSVQARAQREYAPEFEKRKKWLERRRAEVDTPGGVEAIHIETDHFIISWDIPKITIGRVVYDKHRAAHLYATRMEELYKQILELMSITDAETLHTKHRLVFFDSQKPWRVVAPVMANQGASGGNSISLIGPGEFIVEPAGTKGSCMVMWWDRNLMPDDDALYQSVTHKVSHHIFNDVRKHKNWLYQRYGWVYEGLAFYLEIRNFGPPMVRCGREQGMFQHWKGKAWEANVKKAVLANEYPSFQKMMQSAVDELNSQQIQFAWSWIDYLMWYDPTRMDEFLELLKFDQPPTRDALRTAYGMTVGQFLDGWTQFVKREYSIKPKDGPTVRPPRDKQKYPDVAPGLDDER